MSVGLAFVIFLLAAAMVVGVTFLRDGLSDDNGKGHPNADLSADTPTETADQSADLLVVFKDSDRVLASTLTVWLDRGKVAAEAVNLTDELIETLDTEGVFPFLGRCFAQTDQKRQKYIVFDGENFSKITDIYGGLVYNESGSGEVLLTGGQAVAVLTDESFPTFCKQLTEKLLGKNAVDGFRLVANTTLNNLSYPEFFEKMSP